MDPVMNINRNPKHYLLKHAKLSTAYPIPKQNTQNILYYKPKYIYCKTKIDNRNAVLNNQQSHLIGFKLA